MHEASLTRALIRQVEAIATQHDAARIVEVSVSVGDFAGVEPELLQVAFERQIAETPLCGVRLNLARVPLEGVCSQCMSEFLIESFRFACPCCESSRVTVVRGEEMILESVVFEDIVFEDAATTPLP
jgi:hydrogenase nickel incorporation protein HypA/HybF